MQDSDESQITQPKRRGRPPKNQTTQTSQQPKRRGRPPKKNQAEEAQTPELFVSAPEETGIAHESQPEDSDAAAARFAEAASGMRKAGRGRFKNFKRQDGPKWRDITEQTQSESSSDADADTSEGEVFVPSGDDFAFSGDSREDGRDFPQTDSSSENADDSRDFDSAEDSPVPSAYSTTDDDLLQDNYRNSWREDSENLADTSDSAEAADERPWPDGAENADSPRQQNQRDFRNNRRNEFQQNRQFGDRQNNKWRNNKKGAFDNNRQQNNRQNQQQRQNGDRQNQNRQNRQQNNRQNQQQQNKPNNQNNRQQNRQNKPKTDFGGINPAKLLDWDALKSEQAIAEYLALAYFGKTAAEQTPAENLGRALQNCENADTADTNAAESVSADFENAASAGQTPEMLPQNTDATAQIQNGESAQTPTPEDAPASADTAEEPEIQNTKPDAELSYWEMLERSNAQMLDDSSEQKSESTAEEPAPSQCAQPQSQPAAVAENPQTQDGAAAEIFAPEYSVDVPECGRLSALENFDEICKKTPKEISEALDALGIAHSAGLNKNSLVFDFYAHALAQRKLVKVSGYLDVFENGQGGAVVFSEDDYRLLKYSVYVPQLFIEKYALKRGHKLEVLAALPDGGECPFAVKICSVMGGNPDAVKNVVAFNDLVPYYPTRRIIMESQTQPQKANISMRAVDLLAPVGLGQRGLIVAPPRTGKTVLMQSMAHSILENVPTAHLIILLVDERPEEVTDFKRSVAAEVAASTFDADAASHVHTAEMVISRARRMVEDGEDVVILLDSITRLARAYNALMPNGGRTMSGGVEANALQKPKKFFGSARNIEGGGSLTILATALVETGSKMDEVIFEEFKGTGNLELHLDRALSDKRIYPAINIEKSGTRKEELLYHPAELEKVYTLRRALNGVPIVDGMEMLIQRLKKTKTNVEFLLGLNR